MSKNKMQEAWNKIEKHHGEEGMFAGNENMTTYSDVISTGSYLVDDALGIWGIPRGHVIQYAGFESSGKTFLSLVTIAEWQKKNPDNWAMFIDAEFTFDANWTAGLGVDLDRLMVYRENSGIKIFERLVGTPGAKIGSAKQKPGILDLEKENPSGLGLIVIDSIAAMQPPQEETSEVGKANMALMARFLPPELRKVTPLLSETGVTLICINQLRMKPGVMYGNPEESPGGATLKHACAQMIHLAKMNGKDAKIEGGDGEISGTHVRARIDKNKKAPPWRTTEFAIDFSKGIIDKNIEIRDLGTKYGIIQRPSNKTYELDGVKYNGKDAIAEALMDETLQQSILTRIKEAKKNGVVINDEQHNEEN